MNYVKYRKHPRVYNKKLSENEEDIIELGVISALGVLASTFVGGIVLGYILKRR